MRESRTAAARFLLFVATALASATTTEARAQLRPPCAGCVLEAAPRPGPSPLVVLLHGDGESASARAAMWRSALRQRGLAMLSLACPVELGCRGSFWRWDGDPSWLAAQVDAAARRVPSDRPIDRQRVWLIGWSGGASYLGWRVAELSEAFAAVVFHGGGMAPSLLPDGRPRRCASPPLPALFLVGDRNPLHHLALALRKSLLECGHEVAWHLLPGADHQGERAALGEVEKVTSVLNWLRPRVSRRNTANLPGDK